jgi:hypothetical protein
MKEALGSSETLILARATRRNIPEDTIVQVYIGDTYWPVKHLGCNIVVLLEHFRRRLFWI